jgi:tetrahydromethanopterin S-methyltransferase subunit B
MSADFRDSFPPAEDSPGAAEFVRGFVVGLCLAGFTAITIGLVMLKVPQ